MLRGWHAENGVRLGDPRLGFVCTKQTVDGQDALEGYFPEHDRTLRPEERFALCSSIRRRRRGCPRRLGRSSGSPKARRNCAKDYIGSVLPELIARFATAEARSLGGRSADLTGLQLADELKAMLGVAADGAEGFAERSAALRQRRLIKPPRRRRAMPSSFRRRAGT